MTSEQLFEDYDPDLEDVFGRNEKITPRCIDVTEKQKTDPLRKPKVILGAVLSAEKLPITVKQIEQRMKDEDGRVMDPTVYGFKTLEDLLNACSDTVVHHRTRDGTHTYAAKVNEANKDIMELVQQQTDRNEAKKAPRSFLRTGTGAGSYGSAFRKGTTTTRILGEDMSLRTNRGTTQQFQARNKLAPSKTIDRVRNLAEVLRSYRSEIGKEHPDEAGRVIVTLAALQQKFKDIYGLPAWGKLMSEPELHAALDTPEFAGILRFWKLNPDGDVYVEELEEAPSFSDASTPAPTTSGPPVLSRQPTLEQRPSGEQLIVNRAPTPEQLVGVTSTRPVAVPSATPSNVPDDAVSINSLDDFSVADTTANSNMLLQEDKSDGFFESGPGFGGNVRRAPTQPPNDAYQELYDRFRNGVPPAEERAAAQTPTCTTPAVDPLDLSQQESSFEFNSDDDTLDHPEVQDPTNTTMAPTVASKPLPMRPVDSAFSSTTSRSIIPRNPMKLVADYVKSRGTVPYSSLPDDDRVMVNFSKKVFKVFATQPGEQFVRLVDPECDTSKLVFDDKDLREPTEADLRWMWDQQVTNPIPKGRVLVKPVMFVAPRGFLVVCSVDGEGEDPEETKIGRMEGILRAQMQAAPLRDLEKKDIRPGMQAVYMYREGRDVRYYRVLVLGHAHQDGDVMVLLVDHDDQYCVDVQLNQLFPMPLKAGFKYFAPNVQFAALHGTHGMAEEEQHIMWKNADEEDHKSFVVGIFGAEQERVLNVDMLWKNEFGEYQWLSQIAARRGAMIAGDTEPAIHLTKSPRGALNGFGDEFIMEFVDYSAVVEEVEQQQQPVHVQVKEEPHEPPQEPQQRARSITPPAPTMAAASSPPPQIASPYAPTSLNVFAMFDQALADKNLIVMMSLVQFARVMATNIQDEQWEEAENYMKTEAAREGFRI